MYPDASIEVVEWNTTQLAPGYWRHDPAKCEWHGGRVALIESFHVGRKLRVGETFHHCGLCLVCVSDALPRADGWLVMQAGGLRPHLCRWLCWLGRVTAPVQRVLYRTAWAWGLWNPYEARK